jgi:hypothetical protein
MCKYVFLGAFLVLVQGVIDDQLEVRGRRGRRMCVRHEEESRYCSVFVKERMGRGHQFTWRSAAVGVKYGIPRDRPERQHGRQPSHIMPQSKVSAVLVDWVQWADISVTNFFQGRRAYTSTNGLCKRTQVRKLYSTLSHGSESPWSQILRRALIQSPHAGTSMGAAVAARDRLDQQLVSKC